MRLGTQPLNITPSFTEMLRIRQTVHRGACDYRLVFSTRKHPRRRTKCEIAVASQPPRMFMARAATATMVMSDIMLSSISSNMARAVSG